MEEIEEYSNNYIICPFCKNEHEPSLDSMEDYESDTIYAKECENCEKTFAVKPNCEWSWTTNIDCDILEKDHEWATSDPSNKWIGTLSESNPELIYCVCKVCGDTQFIKFKDLK